MSTVCSRCGGTIKFKVLTERKKRGRFLQIIHFTQGRCTVCKRKYVVDDERDAAIRSKDQKFFL